MGYIAKINGNVFFNTDAVSDDYLITKAVINKTSGVSGTFTFKVPPCNTIYNNINRLIDYVDVYKNDVCIYSGRVINITKEFDTQLTVECEDVLNVLNDSVFRPSLYENTTCREVFRAIINNHNSQVETSKQITVGRITVPDSACYRNYELIETSISRLNDLSESYEGRIVVYRKSDGKLYIDWLKSYDGGCSQAIDFGENMLDYAETENSADIVTVLVPQGATDGETNQRIDIKSVTVGGVDYVMASTENIQKYGYIYGTKIWDDVTEPSNLKTKAENYVSAVCTPIKTIKVRAVDLADAGYDVDSFDVGQRIKVRSTIHGIDDFFDCTSISIDLLNPASNKLQLGGSAKGYVQSTKNGTESQKKLIERIRREAISKSFLQLAIENATSLITGNSGGYVIMHDSDADGKPDEILIMDTPDIETATKVWRWNNSGLGYSSNGYNGTYGTAITMDGQIVGSYIAANSISLSELASDVTTPISTATSTANTAKSTADSASSTANAVSTTVNGWKYSNTTYINGGRIYTGSISADKISVTDLSALHATIGGWSINDNSLSSCRTVDGTTYGLTIRKYAYDELGYGAIYVSKTVSGTTTYPFRLNHDGSMVATNATISGTITTGALTATGGKIGSWTINDNSIYGGSSASGTESGMQNTPNWAFYAGYKTDGTYKFRVTQAGKVTCSDIDITGGSINVSNAAEGENWIQIYNNKYGCRIANNNIWVGCNSSESYRTSIQVMPEGYWAYQGADSSCKVRLCHMVQNDSSRGAAYYYGYSAWVDSYDSARIWCDAKAEKVTATYCVSTSDVRKKDVIGEISDTEATALLTNVKPINYLWKHAPEFGVNSGFSAQEIRDTLKDNGIGYRSYLGITINNDDPTKASDSTTNIDIDENAVTYTVDYAHLVSVLWKGWQMHEAKIVELEARIAELEAK